MDSILLIKGNVKYTITLDPGVWIFDDRRVDLTTYFNTERKIKENLEEYTKSISKHWDREIREGAIYPPTKKSEKTFLKEQILTGTFGIPLRDFLTNSSPAEDAKFLTVVSEEDEITLPIEKAYDSILGFSLEGKPLREDGPVHFYFGDASNQHNPIKRVKGFIVV